MISELSPLDLILKDAKKNAELTRLGEKRLRDLLLKAYHFGRTSVIKELGSALDQELADAIHHLTTAHNPATN